MNFQSQRLFFRRLIESDREGYFDMMNNPKVMDPIPRPVMSRKESDDNFDKHSTSDFQKGGPIVLAVVRKDSDEFIGLAAYLMNDENDHEIGYRLREKHWGVGFGTEVCRAFIDHGFKQLKFDRITADVNVANLQSVKILEKFFQMEREFQNEKDNCLDRRYSLSRLQYNQE